MGLGPRLAIAAAPIADWSKYVRRKCCWLGIHSYEIVGVSFHVGSAPDRTTLQCRCCRREITRPNYAGILWSI